MTEQQPEATPVGVPPYFDVLFALLEKDDPTTVAAFGRHVHWGYWEDPAAADGSADDYAAAAEVLSHRLCDAAGIADNQAILDVGCGFGGTIASMNERYSGLSLTGLNIDERQLVRARKCVPPQKNNTIEFVQGDACDLPFADAAFDRVTAVECIFHFGDRGKFFREAARVLKPGGNLTICDFIPPARVVPYLESPTFNPLTNESTRLTYGRIDVLSSMENYAKFSSAAGLALGYEEDMTFHTQPTYQFLRNHMQKWEDQELAGHFDKATAQLATASRKGLLQYKILRFDKPS